MGGGGDGTHWCCNQVWRSRWTVGVIVACWVPSGNAGVGAVTARSSFQTLDALLIIIEF